MPEDELVEGMIQKCLAHYEKGEYRDGLACFDEVTEFKEDALRAWYLKGMCHYQLAEYREAMECFEKALAQDAGQAPVWHAKGLCCYKLAEFKVGGEAFLKAAELEPKNPDELVMAGICFAFSGDEERSKQAMALASAYRPQRVVELLQLFFESVVEDLSYSPEERMKAQETINSLRERALEAEEAIRKAKKE